MSSTHISSCCTIITECWPAPQLRGRLYFFMLCHRLLDIGAPEGFNKKQGESGVKQYPNMQECQALLDRCRTPEPVRAHCRAVARRAAALAQNAPEPVDVGLLECACLLHDLCRAQGREHPRRAAEVLSEAGWPELAEIVGQHHDLGPEPCVEAQILYLADKLVSGVRFVTLSERFDAARERCGDESARAAWQRRYEDAKALAAKFRWEE